jgi:hypothetical protein
MSLTTAQIARGTAAVSRAFPHLRVVASEFAVPDDPVRTHALFVLDVPADKLDGAFGRAMVALEAVLGIRDGDHFTIITLSERSSRTALTPVKDWPWNPRHIMQFVGGVRVPLADAKARITTPRARSNGVAPARPAPTATRRKRARNRA